MAWALEASGKSGTRIGTSFPILFVLRSSGKGDINQTNRASLHIVEKNGTNLGIGRSLERNI